MLFYQLHGHRSRTSIIFQKHISQVD
jgi:hypothetical protein